MRFLSVPLLLCLGLSAQETARRAAVPDASPPTVKPEDKCSIEGTVINAQTGEPLKNAHLTLRPLAQPSGVPYGTSSDASGHYLIDDVDPGRYGFSSSRNRFVTQAYSPKGDKHSSTITLSNGQHLKEVTFKMVPQGVIAGRILDGEGEPLAGVQVEVMRYMYQRGRRQLQQAGGGASTNDLGEFRIFGLAPGKYIVSAQDRSNSLNGGPAERVVGSSQAVQAAEEGYIQTYYPNTTNPESSSPFDVLPGAQIQGVNMTLTRSRTVRIKGRLLTGSTDRSLARRTSIMLMTRDGQGVMFGSPRGMARVIDSNGTFEMRGVTPGSYWIMANLMDGNQRYTAGMPVDVGSSNLEGIELRLEPPVELSGRVVLEENADLKGAPLTVTLETRRGPGTMGGGGGPVKDDMSFKITTTPEQYDVNVFGLPEGFFLKSVRLGSQDVTQAGLDFTRGVPGDELTIVVNPNGAQIEGTVQNAKSENAAGVMVTLIPDAEHRSQWRLYKIANTDQNGHFSMKGVPPGEYTIYGWEDIEQGAYQDPDYVKPHESAGQRVSIKQGDHRTLQLKAIAAENGTAVKPQ